MSEIILETSRCYVREIQVSDVPAELVLYDSPHMTDYIEPLYDLEKEKEYQRLYIERIYGKYGYGMWAVFSKETDRLIGEAGLEHRIDINREKFPYEWMFEDSCAEIGFCMAEDIWGQGYCTEVCRAIIEYCREHFGIRTVFARADRENVASVRVLTKLGLRPYADTERYYIRELPPIGESLW